MEPGVGLVLVGGDVLVALDPGTGDRNFEIVRRRESDACGTPARFLTLGPVTAGPVTAGPVTAGPVTAGRVTVGLVAVGLVTRGLRLRN